MALDESGAKVRKGLLITTIGGLLFTLDLPLLRLAHSDKWTLVAMRGFFLFLSINFVWYLFRQSQLRRGPYIAGIPGIAVALTNTLANITYIGAILETSAANVVFITALIPVMTALMSRIFIGERVHSLTWVATIVSILGVGIIVGDSIGSGKMLGDILAIVSTLCTAAAFTIIRASGRNVATSLAIGSLSSALIAIVFFSVAPVSLLAPAGFGVPGLVWVMINGLVAIPLASTLIANGPRFLPSADVSMFFLLETVLTPIWVWWLFGEIPTGPVLIGGIIVIATLIVHSCWRLATTLRAAQPAWSEAK
ncbi:MAG: DMT family transporter [Rhizobiales bacterium]|nr:DMT family transporter [Hyphomicrobiales bacterium]